MEPRLRPTRRLALVAAALLLPIGLASCQGTGPVGAPPAAQVGDSAISLSDAETLMWKNRDAEVAAAASDPAAQEAARARFARPSVEGLPAAPLSEALTDLVQLAALEQALDRLGGTVTDEDRAKADEAYAQGGIGTNKDKAFMLRTGAVTNALLRVAKPSDADLRELFDLQADSLATYCLGAIAADEVGATRAAERIADGEDFAAVFADLNTTDVTGSPDGLLGCGTAEEIGSAQLGVSVAGTVPGTVLAIQPVDATTNAVLVVTDVQEATFETARAQLESLGPRYVASREVQALLAEITIDPRFGTWSPDSGTILGRVDPTAPPAAEDPFSGLIAN